MTDIDDLKYRARKLMMFKEDAFFGRMLLRTLRRLKVADNDSTLIYFHKFMESDR